MMLVEAPFIVAIDGSTISVFLISFIWLVYWTELGVLRQVKRTLYLR